MKTTAVSIAVGVVLLFGGQVATQNAKAAEPGDKSKDTALQAPTEQPAPAAEDLEARSKATLTKATMTGRWCSIKDGVLGLEKEDKYTIISVTRLSGDNWVINARLQYGTKDIVAPIPVQVKWAGDAP